MLNTGNAGGISASTIGIIAGLVSIVFMLSTAVHGCFEPKDLADATFTQITVRLDKVEDAQIKMSDKVDNINAWVEHEKGVEDQRAADAATTRFIEKRTDEKRGR